MNTLQDIREAQQMWEWKFSNAGREGIVLNCGKTWSIKSILNRITSTLKAPVASDSTVLRDRYQAV
jgi:hypothetical protein